MGWHLDYLPDGFTEIKSVSNGGTTGVIYANAENIQISWIYMESANSNTSVNNEGVAYSTQTIDGVTYYLFEAVGEGEDNSIIWELDGYRFVISSTIPLTDVQKMATSLSTSSHTDSN
jgi:hypothetical protein